MGEISVINITQLAPSFIMGETVPSDYSIFYKEMATGMNEMLVSIDSNLDAIVRCIELLDYLIDLTTDVSFDANQAVLDIYSPMSEDVYWGLIFQPRNEIQVSKGVNAVNDHTKRYITDDLTDYVNNEVWPGNCVPFEWARASAETGEDISGWNVCDSS